MEQAAFWVTTPSHGALLSSNLEDGQGKTEELASVFNQPTVMNFATIFAGASASIAHTGSSIPGQTVPSLNQIGISPSKRTATLIPISNLQPVACITDVTNAIESLTPTTAPIVNALNGTDSTTSATTVYTLPLFSDPSQITKNFIQQAAAESGLTSSNLTNARNPIFLTSNPEQTSQTYEIEVTNATSSSESSGGASIPENSISVLPIHNDAYTCNECGKSFENSGQLNYHTFVAHGELQARPHKCTACPESFLTELHLSDHIKALHLPAEHGGGPPFMCSECLEVFDDGCNLNFHLYIAHTIQGSKSKQQRQFPCPECRETFDKSALRATHMRNMHHSHISTLLPTTLSSTLTVLPANDGVMPHKCTECGKSFKTQSYLKQHIMSVHNKPLKCTICGRGFGRKSDLKRHMRGVHMKKRPHICEKCGWTFSEVGNLKHHIQAVHRKQKNFRCIYCDKTFALLSYLRTHLNRMHSIDLDATRTVSENEKDSENLSLTTVQLNSASQQEAMSNSEAQTVISLAATGTRPNTISLEGLQINIAQVVRCYECCQTFENAQLLQEHVMSTHSQPFWCTLCGEGFSVASHLQLHLQLRHSDIEQQPVQSPAIQAVQAIDLQRTSNGQFSLEIRNALPVGSPMPTHGVPTAPKQHMIQSQPPTMEAPVEVPPPNTDVVLPGTKCGMCGTICSSPDDKHICWKKVPITNSLSLSSVNIERERPHVCNACGKRFKTLTHMKQHVRCVHSNEKPHKCNQCEKSFARTSDLNRHIKGVHQKLKSIRTGVFVAIKCSECGVMFAETSQLKRHIYTHHLHGKSSFKCADCQEGFTNEVSFQNHICHEEEKPHFCTVCSKRFHRLQQLRRHTRAAHGRHHEEPQVHKCFQCERVFGRSIDLERHIQAVHLKEKPHKCTICSKSFGLQGNLNKHVKAVHLLEKPHPCIECGKRFAHVGVLKRHLRDIHFYDKKATVKQRLASIQMKKARVFIHSIATENSQNRHRGDIALTPSSLHMDQQDLMQTTAVQSNAAALAISGSIEFVDAHSGSLSSDLQVGVHMQSESLPSQQGDDMQPEKVSA